MLHKKTSFGIAAAFLLTILFGAASYAFGSTVQPVETGLAFSSTQTFVFLIGALVPLATYTLNHYAPWVSEPAKALALLVVSAASAGLYQALDVGNLGLNAETLQIVMSAILASLTAHKFLYVPAGINLRLKAETNVQDGKS